MGIQVAQLQPFRWIKDKGLLIFLGHGLEALWRGREENKEKLFLYMDY